MNNKQENIEDDKEWGILNYYEPININYLEQLKKHLLLLS